MTDFDVIVVGAGPGGSAVAAHVARAGLTVALVEKASFPRDKICGDALTPRAVKELDHLGFAHPGWHEHRGLRLFGGGHRCEIDWPRVSGMPTYGLTAPRTVLDHALARHAQRCGVTLMENTQVTRATFAGDWVTGIEADLTDDHGRRTGKRVTYSAPLVIAADGVASRTAVTMGITRRTDRPMGVAVRTYFSTPRDHDPYIESWLELRAPATHPGETTNEPGNGLGEPLPGYGWIFPLGNGTANVGLGMLNTSPQFRTVDYKRTLTHWVRAVGPSWELDADAPLTEVGSAALPMAFNRTPHFKNGVMLVGDAAGMVNTFNGEGIDYALEAARIAADIIVTHHGYPTGAWKTAMATYPRIVKEQYGKYVTLGRMFAHIIAHPDIMKLGLKYGMSSATLMKFVVKLLANLAEEGSHRDIFDHVIAGLTKVVPATSNNTGMGT